MALAVVSYLGLASARDKLKQVHEQVRGLAGVAASFRLEQHDAAGRQGMALLSTSYFSCKPAFAD